MTEILDHFDPDKNYDRLRFLSDRIIQTAEFNEMVSSAHHRLKGVADALLKDGDVIRDCDIIIDQPTGIATLGSGALYLAGAVRGIAPAQLQIELEGTVTVGAYLVSNIITALEDPALLNPAAGTRGYGEPGADRLQVIPEWGIAGARPDGEFYPVYTVIDGYVRSRTTPVGLDSVVQALEGYDRESTGGGTYVVSGLDVKFGGTTDDDVQTWLLDSGKARVAGRALDLATSRRITYAADPTTRLINSEAHLMHGPARQRISVNRPAIASIESVQVTKERTVQIVHGAYTGVSDPLPDAGVLEILLVKQAATTYHAPADYRLTAGYVDWSPAGAEPATGSSYDVTYRYIETVEPIEPDSRGFSVEGAVDGTLALVTYRAKLPRIDRLCLDSVGNVVWQRGVPSNGNPLPPPTSPTLLSLALVHQTWLDDTRRIVADNYRVISMFDLARYGARLDTLTKMVAEQALRTDASMRNASLKSGMFVDPLIDDSLRDAGIEQTASIVAGALMLSIDAQAHPLPGDVAKPTLCQFTLADEVKQLMRTGWMPINAYGSQLPVPASIALNPAVDRWTETAVVWGSPRTEHFVYDYFDNVQNGVRSSKTTTTQSYITREAVATLRAIPVAFTITGFGAREQLTGLTFDGVNVLPAGVIKANDAGVLNGTFNVPAGIPSGSKAVKASGAGGSTGTAVFTGEGIREVTNKVYVTTIIDVLDYWTGKPIGTCFIDPLAQTFRVTRTCQLAQIILRGKRGGDEPLLIHIRETVNGLPTGKVLAEQRIPASTFGLNESFAGINLDLPPTLFEGVEYALVIMTNGLGHELVIAELGKYDVQYNRWVSNQPYEVGVLLSSANAQTWTPHQDRDLYFSLQRASIAPANRTRVVPLGAVAVEDATDLMMLGNHLNPAAGAGVEYRLTLPSGEVLDVASDQPVRLAAPITGNVAVSAVITATEDLSGVLLPGSNLVVGKVASEGTYVSRAFNLVTAALGTNQRLTVVYDAVLPPGSTAVAHYRIDDGPWHACDAPTAAPADNGAVELTSVTPGLSGSVVRVRLTLAGTPAARPTAHNIRVIVSE
ncbi:DUF4815 domain-containing protein [Pseudomonas paralcaligenes]|uniref:DUF4815 domain-containing protein n=1 Tax=Pseudomonas paralcaligenes TaxID=2772558 RepID=UPI001C805EEF|nr:DUF4815 domain-containing protein [Pseudomonas paralcaligenes]